MKMRNQCSESGGDQAQQTPPHEGVTLCRKISRPNDQRGLGTALMSFGDFFLPHFYLFAHANQKNKIGPKFKFKVHAPMSESYVQPNLRNKSKTKVYPGEVSLAEMYRDRSGTLFVG